jgi:hypothetical protein
LGLPPTAYEPAPVIHVQQTPQQETPLQPPQRDPPVHIEPKPRRRRRGSSTYKPRKRIRDFSVAGLIITVVFSFTLPAAQCLRQMANPPREPLPPAPLVSEEEMERFLDGFSDQMIESAVEEYETAKRNGLAKDARVQATIIASEYQRLGDEANYQKWRAKAEAESSTEFAERVGVCVIPSSIDVVPKTDQTTNAEAEDP